MEHEHSPLRSAAVLALCGLFAVLAVGLAILSSGVYRSAAAASDGNSARRTALSYLVNQVRRADRVGGVAVGAFGDGDAVALTETVEGTDYVTILYCLDGQLMELYAEAGSGLTPADGLAVLALSDLSVETDGARITFTVTAPDGTVSAASVSPRCGFEEVGEL